MGRKKIFFFLYRFVCELKNKNKELQMVRANSTKQEFEPILSVGSLDLTKDSLQELQQLFAKKSLTELSNVQALKTLSITNNCAHNQFFTNSYANDIIGIITFIPMLYPFESWRLHHVNTAQRRPAPLSHVLSPIYWISDLILAASRYFDLSQFDKSHIGRLRLTTFVVYSAAVACFSMTLPTIGAWPLFKFWLIPLGLFHFSKNVNRHVRPVQAEQQTKSSSGNLPKGVHQRVLLSQCRVPLWARFLIHDVNFQVPAAVGASIPCYHLAEAQKAMKSLPGYVETRQLEWYELLYRLATEPQLNLWNAKSTENVFENDVAQVEHKVDSHNDEKNENNGKPLKKNAKRTSKRPSSSDSSSIVEKDHSLIEKLFLFLKNDVNWLHTPLLLGTPLIALYGLLNVSPTFGTIIFSIIYYFITGVGITGGYHRLWSHRAYDAALPIRMFLLAAASGAVEGSCRWWCRDHRAHHRYTDTDRDPYSIQKGFFYAHIGWMLIKQDPNKIGRADISDLNADPMIRFQHRHYLWFAIVFGFVLPSLVCGVLFNDYVGGFYYAGVLRLVFVHHATFCVNSVAHYIGNHTYADTNSPRDSFITALLTLGEGYHCFHHEFPQDYRNAIKWYQYDPTKLFVRFCAFFGLAYNLHRFPENEIYKGALQIAEKRLAAKRRALDWGPPPTQVPVMTAKQVAEDKRPLLTIAGLVYNIDQSKDEHPGGEKIIMSLRGKDATKAFDGGVYNHSRAARNLLHTMLVARLPTAKVEKLSSEPPQKHTIEYVPENDDHGGVLAHIEMARDQLKPVTSSAYEIDYPIE